MSDETRDPRPDATAAGADDATAAAMPEAPPERGAFPAPPTVTGSASRARRSSWPVIGALLLLLVVVASFGIRAWLDPERRLARLRERDPARAAQFAAELALRDNPGFERVATDPEAGTMTVRNKTTGAEIILGYDELLSDPAPGDPALEADDEPAVEPPPERLPSELEDIPPWVPRHPREQTLEVTFALAAGDTASGAFTFRSDAGAASVLDHYAQTLRDAGYGVERETLSPTEGSLVAILDGGRRSVRVAARTVDGETTTAVQYQQRSASPATP